MQDHGGIARASQRPQDLDQSSFARIIVPELCTRPKVSTVANLTRWPMLSLTKGCDTSLRTLRCSARSYVHCGWHPCTRFHPLLVDRASRIFQQGQDVAAGAIGRPVAVVSTNPAPAGSPKLVPVFGMEMELVDRLIQCDAQPCQCGNGLPQISPFLNTTVHSPRPFRSLANSGRPTNMLIWPSSPLCLLPITVPRWTDLNGGLRNARPESDPTATLVMARQPSGCLQPSWHPSNPLPVP